MKEHNMCLTVLGARGSLPEKSFRDGFADSLGGSCHHNVFA